MKSIESLILHGRLHEAEKAAKNKIEEYIYPNGPVEALVRIKHGRILQKFGTHFECAHGELEFPELRRICDFEENITGVTVSEIRPPFQPLIYSYMLGRNSGFVWFATGCEPVNDPDYVKTKLAGWGFPPAWIEENLKSWVSKRDPFPAFMLKKSRWED